jgi:hypothetical protein
MGIGCVFVSQAIAAGLPVDCPSDPLVESIRRLDQRPADPALAVLVSAERLSASIEQLELHLSKAGPELAKCSRWLDVSRLKQELAAAKPDLGTLRSIQERFYQNQAGLELPAFVLVRHQLRTFIVAQEYAAADSPNELYRQRLDELNQVLQRLCLQPQEQEANRAGRLLAWLEALDDSGATLAREARSRLCRINALGQASGRLANFLLQRPVDERNYIAETVLGSFTHGVAITQGQLTFATVPDREQGALEIHLQGRVLCPANVADRRRVSVYNSSLTSIDARKQVFIDDLGLHLARATASSATSIEIQDVDARRVVQRLVWRRANRLTSEAESLTSRRAESEAALKLDRQADAALGNINNVFCEKIRAPLIRLHALPAQIQFWTDTTLLRVAVDQRNELQLSAAGPPPALATRYDLAGCVHESMINNLCESLLAGRIIHDEEWLEMMHLLLGERPRPLWVHDRAERWAVIFANERPLTVMFQEDRLAFVLHLDEVQRGTEMLHQGVEIAARFVPQIDQDGPWLLRDGDLEIRFTSRIDQEREALLRHFLVRKFDAVFPTVLHFYGLMPPAGGSMGKLCQLKPAEFQSDGGWLRLGYELTGKQ